MRMTTRCVLAVCLTLACGTMALAAPRPVTMASPAPNAAMVLGMPGMINGEQHMTIGGVKKSLWDGIVVRKSRINNEGKIVIPPSGVFTTVRSGNWHPFDNEPINLGGRSFYYINQRSVRDVLHDVTFRPGEMKKMNHSSRGWQLTMLDKNPFFMDGAYSATFKLVKATGNYYGEAFPVMTGPNVNNDGANGTAAKGYYEKAGISERDGRLDDFIMGRSVSADGRTYVIVDSITPEAVKVRELATDSITDAWISPSAPVIKSYAKGESFSIGKARVEVADVKADSVTVRISEGGKSVEKTFGPWNDENRNKLYLSESVRDRFWTLSPSGKEIVHLNVRAAEGPFADGKAALVAYQDVIDVQDGTPWPFDPRFIARPET